MQILDYEGLRRLSENIKKKFSSLQACITQVSKAASKAQLTAEAAASVQSDVTELQSAIEVIEGRLNMMDMYRNSILHFDGVITTTPQTTIHRNSLPADGDYNIYFDTTTNQFLSGPKPPSWQVGLPNTKELWVGSHLSAYNDGTKVRDGFYYVDGSELYVGIDGTFKVLADIEV
ncbi:MAG: hypothetical protein NC217_07665 [Muribaculaceae bacterium]|nr:hypothetical protein [Muribaculaceae bacterium]